MEWGALHARYRTLFLTVGFFATLTTTTQAQGPAVEPAALAAVNAARSGEWTKAYAEAGQSKDPVVQKAVRWLDYTRANPSGRFAEISSFIEQNPDWPLRRTLLRRAAGARGGGCDGTPANWRKRHPPAHRAGPPPARQSTTAP